MLIPCSVLLSFHCIQSLTNTMAALQLLALLNGKELNARRDAIVRARVSFSGSHDMNNMQYV